MKKATIFLIATLFFSLSFLPVLAEEIITHKAELSEYPGSVTLRAYIPISKNNTYRRASFEWGESTDMPFRTSAKTISPFSPSASNYSSYLSGLKPNTTYYYRLLVEDSDGHVWSGERQSFVTVTRTVYEPASSSGGTSGQVSTANTSKTIKQTASVGNSSSSGDKTSGNANSTGSKNTNNGLGASLFGSSDKSGATALAGQIVNKEGGTKSLYQNILSFAKWAVLALVIFLTTALFVYAASLYERIKKAKKKNKEEKDLPTAPANLPRA